MSKIEAHPIGRAEEDESGTRILLDPAFGPALRGLEGYSHVQVVWWFDRVEDAGSLVERKPYAKGPEELGVFATRSPIRPNPIAVSSVDIAYVDEERATLGLYYIDAYSPPGGADSGGLYGLGGLCSSCRDGLHGRERRQKTQWLSCRSTCGFATGSTSAIMYIHGELGIWPG